VNTALHNMEKRGARLTVGIAGSFGILHYAILAFPARRSTTSDLGVIPTEVMNAADGGLASDAGMGSVVIVVVEPGIVGGCALGF
jgi:hypothetical protein